MDFNHNNKASLDNRCVHLLSELGYKGYGLYWGLVERLLKEKDYSLPISGIADLASDFGVKTSVLNRLIFDFDLFEISSDRTCFRSNPCGIHQFPETR